MTNVLLDNRYSEIVHRLGLGLEAVDALREGRIPFPFAITFDELPLGLPRPKILRHDSAAYALLLDARVGDEVVIRMFDSSRTSWKPSGDRRRYVPRRLRIPLVSGDGTNTLRVRRPFLYPGAAYDISDCVTGVRGRVTRGGEAVRWARVHAIDPETGLRVGVAHGDDRGEFLLVIQPNAGGIAELANPLPLELHVHVPTPPAVADAVKLLDPLWDLPVERVAEPGQPDATCVGIPPWDGWTDVATVAMNFTLGTLMRGAAPFTV